MANCSVVWCTLFLSTLLLLLFSCCDPTEIHFAYYYYHYLPVRVWRRLWSQIRRLEGALDQPNFRFTSPILFFLKKKKKKKKLFLVGGERAIVTHFCFDLQKEQTVISISSQPHTFLLCVCVVCINSLENNIYKIKFKWNACASVYVCRLDFHLKTAQLCVFFLFVCGRFRRTQSADPHFLFFGVKIIFSFSWFTDVSSSKNETLKQKKLKYLDCEFIKNWEKSNHLM